MSYFDTFGPYDIVRDGALCATDQSDFWIEVEENAEGLSTAIGCYLFCVQYRQRIRPWYVGMTAAMTGFKREVFDDPHKPRIYNECLQRQRGRPIMFLFPLMTPGGRFSKALTSGKEVISWLEITLMGFAHRRNPEISNVRDMAYLRNVEVLGLIGKRRGRPFREAQAVRRALLGK